MSSKTKSKDSSPDGELSAIYWYYVVYECVLINLVGFVTLFFQCELQDLERQAIEANPNSTYTEFEWNSLFGHYWLKGDLNCSTRTAQSLTYMVSGWLMIAGVLQLFINFDGLRQVMFPASNNHQVLPRSIKLICMYVFFLCDWYWVVLMTYYQDVIGWHQIVGSAVDIAIRLVFVLCPDLMFKNPSQHMAPVSSSSSIKKVM